MPASSDLSDEWELDLKRIGLIQHEADSPPGTALPWMRFRGFQVQHRRMDLGHSLPTADDVDHLVICGGSMNVDEEALFPWLKEEKKLIEQVLGKGGRIVGLCLGGQLAAEVLGADVKRHHDWEVGWQPVQLNVQPGLQGFEAPRTIRVFQWHHYVFDLPTGAKRLAQNDWWENQAFLWNDQVLGFQFHPETDLAWNRECALDRGLPTTGRSQSAEEILKLGAELQPELERWFHSVMEGFLLAQ